MTSAVVPDAQETLAARAIEVTKIYGQGQTEVRALDNVSVEFPSGRFTAIMGPSGSGKSTLMHCLAGLDRITSGQIFIGDVELNKLSEKQLTLLRRDKVGFVFQAFNLLPTLTAAENVELPLAIAGRKPDRAWVDRVVDAVGLREPPHRGQHGDRVRRRHGRSQDERRRPGEPGNHLVRDRRDPGHRDEHEAHRQQHVGRQAQADADRRGQIADLGRASVKYTEDGDDDQHVQAATDESLCDAERNDQRSVGCARNCLEAGQDPPASGLILGRRREPDPALDSHPCERCGCRDEQSGTDDEDDANVSERDESACQQWSTERADAFHSRGRPVGCDELLGRSCQRRQQRLQCRPDERRGDADERGERVNEELGARESRRGRRRKGCGPQDSHGQQKALAAESVA